jgi:hypothetical protein
MSIKSVIVTRSIEYSPYVYNEFCKECDEEPTQKGFIEFIENFIHEDFRDGNAKQEIKLMDY